MANDHAAAEALYTKLIKENPNNPDALYGMTLIEHERGNKELAMTYLDRALQNKDKDAVFTFIQLQSDRGYSQKETAQMIHKIKEAFEKSESS